MLIEGKVAIVLGGAGVMGRACCKALLAKGAKVVCADITDGKSVEDLRSDKNFVYLRCDSNSEAEVKELFEKTKIHFGKIPDIVMTTVAIIDEFDWHKCLEVNVGSIIRLVNTTLATMGANKGGNGGSVVLMSSISGLKPEYWGPVYSATKHAVIALARSWALDENFSQHRIRFNCICPGSVNTPFLKQVSRAYFYDKKKEDIDENPMIEPSTIGDAFIRIIEDESMNGESILITPSEPFIVHKHTPVTAT